jgi:hypothetical protein
MVERGTAGSTEARDFFLRGKGWRNSIEFARPAEGCPQPARFTFA